MEKRVTYAILFSALIFSACCVQEKQTTTTTTTLTHADIHSEKKPTGLECGGDQECASGHCTLNYNYTHIYYPKNKICCEEGECGFIGRCYENNRPLWMCSCKDSQLVACTTTTSMWTP